MKPRQIRFLMVSLALLAVALCTTAWVMPLADYANATFAGVNDYDRAGESVAIVGDVNADGYDDFLVGARGADLIANTGGGAYLFLGTPAAGWGSDVLVSQADASFGGASYQDHAGHDVAGAGDVNGDGYDDFLIGADGYDAPGGLTKAGRAHLFLGREAADWGDAFDVANSDASFVGETVDANLGHALAGAGDVNGDGYDDLILAAHPEAAAGGYDTYVYLFLGSASPDWGRDASPSVADASFLLLGNTFAYDVSVAGAGDVNGDGYDDVLIGSWLDRAYLVLGKGAADWGHGFDLANAADASLNLEGTDATVAGAGDVNRDGLDDMLVASQYVNAAGNNRGKAYLILGRAAADWGPDFDLANADASFTGANDGDKVGCAAAGPGDVNRDGYDDLLIGACYADATDVLTDTGAAYLVLGRPDSWQVNVDLATAGTARDVMALPGEAFDDQAGTGLAGGGDVNGDGFADLLVGALEYDRDVDSPDVGKVYLVLGTGLALDKAADATEVAAGGQITYSLRYTNTNPWPVQTARVGDQVPANTTYVSCTGGNTCSLQGNTVWWYLGNVPADGTGTVGLVVQVQPHVAPCTSITNTAMITAPSRLNPVYSQEVVQVSGFTVYLPLVVRAYP